MTDELQSTAADDDETLLDELGQAIEHFDAVPGLEGSEYVPHVTLARGGSAGAAEALRDVDIDPIEWVVPELVVYDAVHRERVSRVSLPTSD